MKIRDLFKRTAIRLAATLATFFVLILVGLYAGLYFYLGGDLENRIGARIVETRDTLVKIDQKSNFEALSDAVQDESESVGVSGNVFLLLDQNGSFVAGNVRDVQPFAGLRKIDKTTLHLANDRDGNIDRYTALWTKVSKGQLLVGASDKEIRDTLAALRQVLFWGLIATLLVVFGFSHLYARRTQRRIDALSETLSAVSRGYIDQRVPLSRAGDDIDRVSKLINETLGDLQRLVENVNQSSSDIAHDLKKPIGRLQYQLETVLRNGADAPDYRQAIVKTQSGLAEIVSTFEALLRISQIEAGARKIAFTDLDLKDVMLQVIDIYDAVIEDAGQKFAGDIELQMPSTISGDRELLVQMFANLIENSIRHCPKGTSIRVELRSTGNLSTVTVSDTGPGIPEHERKNVFKRMYRLEKSRTSEGSGLGLSLVAAIAELHSASIKLLDAQPGLRIEIAFPRIARGTADRL